MNHKVILSKTHFIKFIESYTKSSAPDRLSCGDYYLNEPDEAFPALCYFDTDYEYDRLFYELIPMHNLEEYIDEMREFLDKEANESLLQYTRQCKMFADAHEIRNGNHE